MRRPNPLTDENWGKSKMEIIADARKAKAELARKEELVKVGIHTPIYLPTRSSFTSYYQ